MLLAASTHAQGLMARVTHGYANNNGVNIHYVTLGEGPLLVMLHGFPDFWYTWRDQMEVLARNYKVAAIDLRGYNLSDKPSGVENYTFEFLIGDIKAVISQLGEEKAIVAGHDWGGAISWRLAMHAPELVEKLIICNLPHPSETNRQLSKSAKESGGTYADRFFEPDFHKQLSVQWLSGWVQDPEAKEIYQEAFRRSSAEAMLNYYKANFPRSENLVSTTNILTDLPKVQVPVLIIHGKEDRYLPVDGLNNNWNYIDGPLTMVIIPEAGHFVQQDASEQVTRAMVMWLEMNK